MSKLKAPFVVLILSLLACSLADRNAASMAGAGLKRLALLEASPTNAPTPTATSRATLEPSEEFRFETATLEAPASCVVNTGLPTGNLNMRACPGMSCPVIRVLADGDLLDVPAITLADGWLFIRAQDGALGWIASDYCEVKP